ncbi:Holliday junction branch migration protein RuvA [Alphaproteobacteria bacterium LSUCC0684]
MIARLSGTLVEIGESHAVLMAGGVGYMFQATSRCLARMGGVGAEVMILIDTQIRDDRIILTGFSNAAVKDVFTLLQTVQGVGSKAALSILSALSPDDLMLAISAGDKAMITRADGVGPKLAQRIVNELGEKVSSLTLGPQAGSADPSSPDQAAIRDAISALVNLGYGRAEAHAAVVAVSAGMAGASLEALLPAALKELGQ